MSIIEKAATSSALTLSIIPLPFGPMILISLTKVLTTGPHNNPGITSSIRAEHQISCKFTL